MLALTLTAREVAEVVLHRDLKSFHNRRASLDASGFPRPLDIPGAQMWLVSDIVKWLESRRQAPTIDEQAAANAEASAGQEKQSAPPAPQAKRGRGRPPNRCSDALKNGVA